MAVEVLAYSFVVFVVLAIGVWAYQAIILPIERQRLRFELFELRDRLRDLVIDERLREDSSAFKVIHSQLNVMIKSVPSCDLTLLLRVQSADDTVRKEMDRRTRHIQEQVDKSIPEVKEIHTEALRVLAKAFLFNSIILFAWAVPAVALSNGFVRLKSGILRRYEHQAEPIFAMRERDIAAFC